MSTISMAGNTRALRQVKATDSNQQEKAKAGREAERIKQEFKIWQIYQDLQTDIFKTIQDVCLYRAKTNDSVIDKWDTFVKGG